MAKTPFSPVQPDTDGIYTENDDGQNGRVRSQIQLQERREKMEGNCSACQLHSATGKMAPGSADEIARRIQPACVINTREIQP